MAFIIDPITSAVLHIMMVFIARKARTSKLDRYEGARLWLYNGFGQLVAMDAKNPEPRMIDEQRLRIALKKGQAEIRTENSADLSLILSVLSQAQTAPKVSACLRPSRDPSLDLWRTDPSKDSSKLDP